MVDKEVSSVVSLFTTILLVSATTAIILVIALAGRKMVDGAQSEMTRANGMVEASYMDSLMDTESEMPKAAAFILLNKSSRQIQRIFYNGIQFRINNNGLWAANGGTTGAQYQRAGSVMGTEIKGRVTVEVSLMPGIERFEVRVHDVP